MLMQIAVLVRFVREASMLPRTRLWAELLSSAVSRSLEPVNGHLDFKNQLLRRRDRLSGAHAALRVLVHAGFGRRVVATSTSVGADLDRVY